MASTNRSFHSALSRRDLFRLSAAGVVGFSVSGWLERVARAAAGDPARKRSCILLWMNGGPSQMDTFDLKPGTPNGGTFKEIETSVPGLKISEHLPKLAQHAEHLAIVRSMSTKEGDHGRATFLMRTGYLQQGPIRYPTIGSLVAKELGADDAEIPSFVSIAPYRQFNQAAFSSGFLGPRFAPLIVGETYAVAPQGQQGSQPGDYGLKVEDLAPPSGVDIAKADARLDILKTLDTSFASRRAVPAVESHRTAYERAVRLMRSEAGKAFNLDDEPAAVRDAYGRNRFGQGCLMARRLVERNVPFVEVTLGGIDGNNNAFGWDTHTDNFENVRKLSNVLDPAWATLIEDLKTRGLLDTTLIVWMGEFGRTPKVNEVGGRDHYPNAWSTVLAGGGVKGGQAIGRSSKDGMTVEDRPVSTADFLATVCAALGINPKKTNMSDVGRPIFIVDKAGNPVQEALA